MNNKYNDKCEFMPVLAEIENRPVNPLGRLIFWIIVAIILFLITWMFVAKTDIVISSRGEFKSGGGERMILAEKPCIIKNVFCKTGDYVVKGQKLLEISNPSSENAVKYINELINKKSSEKENQKKKKQYREELVKINSLNAKQIIISEHFGYVGRLYGKQANGVILPEQKLLSVISSEYETSFESYISDRDIGTVQIGMPVKIKVDAFSFQKFGMLEGKIVHIFKSDRQQPEQKYTVISVFNEDEISSKEQLKGKLSPGMTVTVEIKTGYRRIIEFFIYPLIKYMDEGMSL